MYYIISWHMFATHYMMCNLTALMSPLGHMNGWTNTIHGS